MIKYRIHLMQPLGFNQLTDYCATFLHIGAESGCLPEVMFEKARSKKTALSRPIIVQDKTILKSFLESELGKNEWPEFTRASLWADAGTNAVRGYTFTVAANGRAFKNNFFILLELPNSCTKKFESFMKLMYSETNVSTVSIEYENRTTELIGIFQNGVRIQNQDLYSYYTKAVLVA